MQLYACSILRNPRYLNTNTKILYCRVTRILLVLCVVLSGRGLLAVWEYFRNDNAGLVIGLVVYTRADLDGLVGMIGAEVLAKTLSFTVIVVVVVVVVVAGGGRMVYLNGKTLLRGP